MVNLDDYEIYSEDGNIWLATAGLSGRVVKCLGNTANLQDVVDYVLAIGDAS